MSPRPRADERVANRELKRQRQANSRRAIIAGEASDPDRLAKTPLPESGVYRFRILKAGFCGVPDLVPARRGPKQSPKVLLAYKARAL